MIDPASPLAVVMKWLETKETYQRTKGRDHYAMGIAWDTGRRPFGDINLLGPETPTDFQDTFSFPLDKYMHAQHDIVIPYVRCCCCKIWPRHTVCR